MKHIPLVAIFCVLVACAPSKEKICGNIDEGIRTYLEKAASRANKDIDIHELKTTGFDMIGAGQIDTLSKAEYARKIAHFLTLQKSAGARAKAYTDSVDYYTKLDSLTTLQITNRWQDPKVYYYSRTYVDVTIGNTKTVDTIRYALDRTFKLIPIL
ncbi:hypothetical protein [Spirosoma sp. KNUC1025]|uniref:hypothetical protein n=1 Tax=Spirosoma sp. KNUC1025 TaxID=2894082 RepID=UPI00386AECBD|nr:hypothetical protein LN737_15470 [Spirosoma sp. KNUC1025]